MPTTALVSRQRVITNGLLRHVRGLLRRVPGTPRVGRAALLGVVAVLVAIMAPGGASAQSPRSEQITGYDVDITVERDGSMSFQETITYLFPDQRHGILRDIPVQLRYDDTYDRTYPLEVQSVAASGGAPDQYALEEPGGGILRIRIGDPDRTIQGEYTYVIRYRVRGGLNAFPDNDELYWNAMGTQWPVPIARPTVRVRTPGAPTEIACFAGPLGSGRPCATAAIEGNGATFAHRALSAFEGLTVVVALPKGVIVPEPQPILEERWSFQRAFSITPRTVGLTGLVAIAVAYALGRLYWTRGRDLRWGSGAVDARFGRGQPERITPWDDEGPVAAEYLPFEGMRPGLMGTLFDETAHPLDVTVTIVDLATRGYLRIEEIEATGVLSWFAKPDWRLVKLKAPADLLPYERSLFNALFEDGDEVQLSDLKNQFASHMAAVQKQLYEEVVSHGWFNRSPETTRSIWIGIGMLALVAAIGVQFLSTRFTHYALVTTPLVAGGLAMLVLHRSMPRRTAAGTAAVRHVRGFRQFIADAEDERAQFAERANLFYEYLPYAIVFGLADKWASAFAGLANPPAAPGWYVSSHPFAMAAFAQSMDTFGVTATGTLVSTPGGSGGSGFGGSSGGGGGGGGGGSW